jgi:hypothetical protein
VRGGGVAGFELLGAALFIAIESATNPFEAACDGKFVAQFTNLAAEQGEVGELSFEIGLFGLEPFEFDEEEFAIAFGGGQFSFCFKDLRFEVGENGVEIGHALGHLVVLTGEFRNSGVAFGHLFLGGLGGGGGLFLGSHEVSTDADETIRDVDQFGGAVGEGAGEREVHLLLFGQLGCGPCEVVGENGDVIMQFRHLPVGLLAGEHEEDREEHTSDEQNDESYAFHKGRACVDICALASDIWPGSFSVVRQIGQISQIGLDHAGLS